MIPEAKVFRVSWHPASDAKLDRMVIRPLFKVIKSIVMGKATYVSSMVHTVSDTIDERLAIQVIEEKGFIAVSKFEYKGDLFIVCKE